MVVDDSSLKGSSGDSVMIRGDRVEGEFRRDVRTPAHGSTLPLAPQKRVESFRYLHYLCIDVIASTTVQVKSILPHSLSQDSVIFKQSSIEAQPA